MPTYWLTLVFIVTNLFTRITCTKYTHRIFIDVQAINFIDPLKNGFRVILTDKFVKNHLDPSFLPTLFATAIPLNPKEESFRRVLYPEKIADKKLVQINDLKERSWYYICIEWENVNRHNETTGTSCQLYRTLDRFGKSQTTAVSEVQVSSHTDSAICFTMGLDSEFPTRVSAYMNSSRLTQSAMTFMVERPAKLDLCFRHLLPNTNYGQLCIVQEPIVSGYTAEGRLVTGLFLHQCFFESLMTKQNFKGLEAEETFGAYKQVASTLKLDSGAAAANAGSFGSLFLIVLSAIWF